jgi:hypothetical protein
VRGKPRSKSRKRPTAKRAKRRSRAALNLEAAALLLMTAAAGSEPRTRAARAAVRLILKAVPSARREGASVHPDRLAQLRVEVVEQIRTEILTALQLTQAQRVALADPSVPIELAPLIAVHNMRHEAAALAQLEAAAANRPAELWN